MSDLGLDELDEYHDSHQPEPDHLLVMLDGDVNSQGIKVSHRDWLDMGSAGWSTTPDKAKAAAYQAATKIGKWEKSRLREIIEKNYPHLQAAILDQTFAELDLLSLKHPLEVEDVGSIQLPITINRRAKPAE